MDLFSESFSALIKSLNKNKVDYLLIGVYAVVLYGYNRFTADMDILFKPAQKNGENLNDTTEKPRVCIALRGGDANVLARAAFNGFHGSTTRRQT